LGVNTELCFNLRRPEIRNAINRKVVPSV